MDGWAFSWVTFSGLQGLAQANLLNKRHCLCYSQAQPPVPSPVPLPPREGGHV